MEEDNNIQEDYYSFLRDTGQPQETSPDKSNNNELVNKATLTVKFDINSKLYCDGDFVGLVEANKAKKIPIEVGLHLITVESENVEGVFEDRTISIEEPGKNYLLIINDLLAKEKQQQLRGVINSIWVEYHHYNLDVEEGMLIHVDFNVRNMRGLTGRAQAWFYNEDGSPIKDTNGDYNTRDGQVAVGANFTPNDDDYHFGELTIFIPYDELHLTEQPNCSGRYYFVVALLYGAQFISDHSTKQLFTTYFNWALEPPRFIIGPLGLYADLKSNELAKLEPPRDIIGPLWG